MKARDLIPGWPRGRSSSMPYPGPHPRQVKLGELEVGDPLTDVIVRGLVRRVLEEERSREYHQQQQQMTDHFRRLHVYDNVDQLHIAALLHGTESWGRIYRNWALIPECFPSKGRVIEWRQ